MVIFNRISYEKDGEYVFSQRYNFVLEDSIACKTTFTLDTIRCQNGLSEQIIDQWKNKNDAPICVTNNKGKRVQGNWVFGIYNLYNRRNAATISFRQDAETGKNQAYRLSIFGIVPSITYNIRF